MADKSGSEFKTIKSTDKPSPSLKDPFRKHETKPSAASSSTRTELSTLPTFRQHYGKSVEPDEVSTISSYMGTETSTTIPETKASPSQKSISKPSSKVSPRALSKVEASTHNEQPELISASATTNVSERKKSSLLPQMAALPVPIPIPIPIRSNPRKRIPSEKALRNFDSKCATKGSTGPPSTVSTADAKSIKVVPVESVITSAAALSSAGETNISRNRDPSVMPLTTTKCKSRRVNAHSRDVTDNPGFVIGPPVQYRVRQAENHARPIEYQAADIERQQHKRKCKHKKPDKVSPLDSGNYEALVFNPCEGKVDTDVGMQSGKISSKESTKSLQSDIQTILKGLDNSTNNTVASTAAKIISEFYGIPPEFTFTPKSRTNESSKRGSNVRTEWTHGLPLVQDITDEVEKPGEDLTAILESKQLTSVAALDSEQSKTTSAHPNVKVDLSADKAMPNLEIQSIHHGYTIDNGLILDNKDLNQTIENRETKLSIISTGKSQLVSGNTKPQKETHDETQQAEILETIGHTESQLPNTTKKDHATEETKTEIVPKCEDVDTKAFSTPRKFSKEKVSPPPRPAPPLTRSRIKAMPEIRPKKIPFDEGLLGTPERETPVDSPKSGYRSRKTSVEYYHGDPKGLNEREVKRRPVKYLPVELPSQPPGSVSLGDAPPIPPRSKGDDNKLPPKLRNHPNQPKANEAKGPAANAPTASDPTTDTLTANCTADAPTVNARKASVPTSNGPIDNPTTPNAPIVYVTTRKSKLCPGNKIDSKVTFSPSTAPSPFPEDGNKNPTHPVDEAEQPGCQPNTQISRRESQVTTQRSLGRVQDFQVAAKSSKTIRVHRTSGDPVYIGRGSIFWKRENPEIVTWHPVSVVTTRKMKHIVISDLEDQAPVAHFRYPGTVEEVHVDGIVTQDSFLHLLHQLYELKTLEIHISTLHNLQLDKFTVGALELPNLMSLEISSSGFLESDAFQYNLSKIIANLIFLLGLVFPSLSYLGISFPFVPDIEKKVMAAIWKCILNHRETLRLLNIECPFMEPQPFGKPLRPEISSEVVEMDLMGASQVNLYSFHLFYWTKVSSTEFWRRFLKTQQNLQYIQFWCEGPFYYKFPYDVIKKNYYQLQTLSMNVDIQSYPDRQNKVPIDCSIFKGMPHLKTLALKGFLLEHQSPRDMLRPDLINVQGLAPRMETIKIMNLNIEQADVSKLVLENNPDLKILYLDNIGTHGNLGLSLDTLVRLLQRASGSIQKIEVFESLNRKSLENGSQSAKESQHLDKGYRLIAKLLLKKDSKPSFRAYRTASNDFEIIYEDDENIDDGVQDEWVEQELKTKSSTHGPGMKRIVSSLTKPGIGRTGASIPIIENYNQRASVSSNESRKSNSNNPKSRAVKKLPSNNEIRNDKSNRRQSTTNSTSRKKNKRFLN